MSPERTKAARTFVPGDRVHFAGQKGVTGKVIRTNGMFGIEVAWDNEIARKAAGTKYPRNYQLRHVA